MPATITPHAVPPAPTPAAPVGEPRRSVVKVPAKSASTKASAKAADSAKATPSADKPLKAGSEVRTPSVNKRAAQAAMQAQMNQAVAPSHDPAAAKVSFTPTREREMPTTAPSPVKKDPKLANNWKTKPLAELTDADVLAMPDTEYMNDVQLAFFKRKLQQLKQDILVNAGETTEHLREDTVVVPDPADRATIEEEHALELRTRDRERKLLKKIEQSITRIDAGDYGYCDETGEPIGVGRLLARPTASLSIEAQQRRELKQKLFGD
ncbi:RNA polymerase-binding protein DksA [Aquabacterium sp. A08]|nr:RNA polymerase-binding protein DksA [Aquabacterium sp. A08]